MGNSQGGTPKKSIGLAYHHVCDDSFTQNPVRIGVAKNVVATNEIGVFWCHLIPARIAQSKRKSVHVCFETAITSSKDVK